jgi:hypothetical protein
MTTGPGWDGPTDPNRTVADPGPPAATGPTGWRPLWISLAVVVGLMLVAAVIVAVALVAGNEEDERAHAVSAPLDDRRAATLRLVDGAATVRLRTGDLDGDLYRASTPDGTSAVPEVHDSDGTVSVGFIPAGDDEGRDDNDGDLGRTTVDIALSSSVTWRVELVGGAEQVALDLRGGRVSEVDLTQGVARVEVWLPEPVGTTTVRERAGVSDMIVHAPVDAPVRAVVANGAGSVAFDGAERSGVPAGTTFATDGWDVATDRFEILADGGVSRLVVDRR